MKWYLAGKMSWVPQYNFPLFDRVSAELREQGFEIVSPAELDDPETRAMALASPDGKPTGRDKHTWGDFLARDVKIIADEIQGIIFLPQWYESRGARLEATVGLLSSPSFSFMQYHQGRVHPIARVTVVAELHAAAFKQECR